MLHHQPMASSTRAEHGLSSLGRWPVLTREKLTADAGLAFCSQKLAFRTVLTVSDDGLSLAQFARLKELILAVAQMGEDRAAPQGEGL